MKTAGSLLSERIRVQLPKFEASTSPHVLTLAFSRHLSGRSRTLQGALSTTAIVLSCWHILVEITGVVQFEAWSASNLVAGLHIIIGAVVATRQGQFRVTAYLPRLWSVSSFSCAASCL